MISIDIATLADGLHDVSLAPTPEDLDLNPDEFSAIEVDVTLDLSDRQILCSIAVRADAALICDRTLSPYTESISGEYDLVFTSDPDAIVPDDDVMRLLEDNATQLVITDAIRDTLLLSVPVRKVAPEARGAEIELQFGATEDDDDGVDPRWDALRKLSSGS